MRGRSATSARRRRPTSFRTSRSCRRRSARVVDVERFRGARVLEVGPKYGVHARWIDRELRPSELVFSDFESDTHLHAKWVELARRARTASSTATCATPTELLELEPFDLVFFLGVLYHSIHHLPLLGMLNRVTKPGGTMLFETTIDPRPRRARAAPLARERQGEGRPDDPGGAARARLDGLAQGHALHRLPARLDRGALPVREDRRAARRRRPLGRRDSASSRGRVACPNFPWSRRPSSDRIRAGSFRGMPDLAPRPESRARSYPGSEVSSGRAPRTRRGRVPAERARRRQAGRLGPPRLDASARWTSSRSSSSRS